MVDKKVPNQSFHINYAGRIAVEFQNRENTIQGWMSADFVWNYLKAN